MNSLIQNIKRPDVSSLSDDQLFEIIKTYCKDSFDKKTERIKMIEKIFSIWSNCDLLDKSNQSIDCLICYEPLTQGDNMTVKCGHQFHSTCISKFVLVNISEKAIQGYLGKDGASVSLDFSCPQCNTPISTHSFAKSDIILEQEEQN